MIQEMSVQLRWAERQAQKNAAAAIKKAKTSLGHERSRYLRFAADKLRDARTFAGAAKMIEPSRETENTDAD